MELSDSGTNVKDRDAENPVAAPLSPTHRGGPGYEATNNTPPADTDEPPPSYGSLYGRVKAAKQESSGPVDFCRKFFSLIFSTLGFIICLGLNNAIPIAMIAIGAVKLKECDAEPYIPIYLIVAGVFYIVKNLSSMVQKIIQKRRQAEGEEDSTPPNKAVHSFDGLIGVFLFAWFIAGNYWIFHIHGSVQYTKGQPMYCDKTLYLFAFWLTIVAYIILGLGLLCGCCCCAMGLAAGGKGNKEQGSS